MSSLDKRIAPVAVSSYVRRWTAETYGMDAARIAVVHNAVDHTAPGSTRTRDKCSRPMRPRSCGPDGFPSTW